MLDDKSRSDTIPVNDVQNNQVSFSHEAKIGKISEKSIFYLMSRGLNPKEAQKLILKTKFNTIINSLFDDKLKKIILDTIDRKFE